MVFLIIPLKWTLVGRLTPAKLQDPSPSMRLRLHFLECCLNHPYVRMGAFLWSGTEVYNAWLRGLGMKVGRQAWIGEDLHGSAPDMVEIGDHVSITRCVREGDSRTSRAPGCRHVQPRSGCLITDDLLFSHRACHRRRAA
jgi:acetyltransferase-like isoleucine patch superfamily enzyme